jgi:hypothetical protein
MDIWDNRIRLSLDEILETSQDLEQSTICDDDCERTCPFIGLLPEETDRENASPLDFSTR